MESLKLNFTVELKDNKPTNRHKLLSHSRIYLCLRNYSSFNNGNGKLSLGKQITTYGFRGKGHRGSPSKPVTHKVHSVPAPVPERSKGYTEQFSGADAMDTDGMYLVRIMAWQWSFLGLV